MDGNWGKNSDAGTGLLFASKNHAFCSRAHHSLGVLAESAAGVFQPMETEMSRFRPPQKPGSKYITTEGARRLREELDELWRVERPRVTQAVSEAAAQGDRSENAEYIYGKRRLREIDSRVRFLRKRLEGMVTVDQPPSDPRRVFFGAWVSLEAEDGQESRYRIVGPDEFDLAPDYISMDSPLGRALLRKALDDEVAVELPGGARKFIIVAIEYLRAPG
jgi:transcription elongation factor GreB